MMQARGRDIVDATPFASRQSSQETVDSNLPSGNEAAVGVHPKKASVSGSERHGENGGDANNSAYLDVPQSSNGRQRSNSRSSRSSRRNNLNRTKGAGVDNAAYDASQDTVSSTVRNVGNGDDDKDKLSSTSHQSGRITPSAPPLEEQADGGGSRNDDGSQSDEVIMINVELQLPRK